MITLPLWLLILVSLFGLPLLVVLISAFYYYVKIIVIVIKEILKWIYG